MEASDSEVRQLQLVVSRDEHILGLHVAVQHAGVMGPLQRPADLDPDRDGLSPRQATTSEPLGQRPAGQELHRDVGPPVGRVARGVDRHDVRMARQGAHRQAFALEPGPGPRVVEHVGEHLQRHGAVELDLQRPVHHTEPAASDLSELDVTVDQTRIGDRGSPGRAAVRRRVALVSHDVIPRDARRPRLDGAPQNERMAIGGYRRLRSAGPGLADRRASWSGLPGDTPARR